MRRRVRGRPPKFGRPGRLLALTLPEDVVSWLKNIHPDPAWAIVSIVESTRDGSKRRRAARPKVELAQLSGRRNLIVVDPHSFRSVPGVAVIPVAAGRAFLALDDGKGVADLELALLDRIDDPKTEPTERKELSTLRSQVREWRRSRGYRFSTRSIILVEGATAKGRRRPPADRAR